MRHDWTGLTAGARLECIRIHRIGDARRDDGRVVLLRTVEVVREFVVQVYLVDLRRDLIHLGRPGLTTIGRDVGAAVVGLHHDAAVGRIYPDVVVVTVRR